MGLYADSSGWQRDSTVPSPTETTVMRIRSLIGGGGSRPSMMACRNSLPLSPRIPRAVTKGSHHVTVLDRGSPQPLETRDPSVVMPPPAVGGPTRPMSRRPELVGILDAP